MRSVSGQLLLAIWFIASVLAHASDAPAQDNSAQVTTVTGIVIDDRTERPISGVLVYLEGQTTVATTDTSGRFNMTVPRGRQTIIASVIGYALLRNDLDVTAVPLDMTIRISAGAGAYHERVTAGG